MTGHIAINKPGDFFFSLLGRPSHYESCMGFMFQNIESLSADPPVLFRRFKGNTCCFWGLYNMLQGIEKSCCHILSEAAECNSTMNPFAIYTSTSLKVTYQTCLTWKQSEGFVTGFTGISLCVDMNSSKGLRSHVVTFTAPCDRLARIIPPTHSNDVMKEK